MAEILVVDDDRGVLDVVRELLKREGHEVRVACDGEAGLKQLEYGYPSAVVLDVDMPVLDGPDMAYRMFLHRGGLERIPIVLLSGAPALSLIARRVGTPYYLGKPFDHGALVSLVRRALVERTAPQPAY